jgi:hypothetical protein
MNHHQKTRPRDGRNDSRGSMGFTASRWAPLKYNVIMVAPETNPVFLAIEQTVFRIINAFSKECQIKCGSN